MSYISLLETFTLHCSIVSNSNYFRMMGVNLPAATFLAQILLFINNSTNQAEGQARTHGTDLSVVEAQAGFPTLGS
jgi:hypothetical protein